MLLIPAIGFVTSGWVLLASAWRSSGSKRLDHAIQHLASNSYSVYLVHIPLAHSCSINGLQTRHLAIFCCPVFSWD